MENIYVWMDGWMHACTYKDFFEILCDDKETKVPIVTTLKKTLFGPKIGHIYPKLDLEPCMPYYQNWVKGVFWNFVWFGTISKQMLQ